MTRGFFSSLQISLIHTILPLSQSAIFKKYNFFSVLSWPTRAKEWAGAMFGIFFLFNFDFLFRFFLAERRFSSCMKNPRRCQNWSWKNSRRELWWCLSAPTHTHTRSSGRFTSRYTRPWRVKNCKTFDQETFLLAGGLNSNANWRNDVKYAICWCLRNSKLSINYTPKDVFRLVNRVAIIEIFSFFIFFFLCEAKDNVLWTVLLLFFFFWLFGVERKSLYVVPSTGIETWLKLFSLLTFSIFRIW